MSKKKKQTKGKTTKRVTQKGKRTVSNNGASAAAEAVQATGPTAADIAAMTPEAREALKEKLAPNKGPKIKAPDFDAIKTAAATQTKPTLAHMMGEMVWLLSQSPTHKYLNLGDLEWLIMPPLLLEQYRIFRGETQPVGLALWAYLTPEAEAKLNSGAGKIAPHEWRAGGLNVAHMAGASPAGDQPAASATARPSQREGSQASGGERPASEGQANSEGTLWLVDLIAPFSTEENKQAQAMLADLMQGPFKGKPFKLHKTLPKSGKREVVEIDGLRVE